MNRNLPKENLSQAASAGAERLRRPPRPRFAVGLLVFATLAFSAFPAAAQEGTPPTALPTQAQFFPDSFPNLIFSVGETVDHQLPQGISSQRSDPGTYSLSPNPPDGLVLSGRNLQGTPTTPMAAVSFTYTYSAPLTGRPTDPPDTISRQFSITILAAEGDGDGAAGSDGDSSPTFGGASVDSQRFRVDSPIRTLELPRANGGDGTLTYTLTPAPPDGLNFDPTRRVISGTPTRAMAETRYRLMVQDEDGDRDSIYFLIEVLPDAKLAFTEAIGPQRLVLGQDAGPLVLPMATGGDAPVTYSLAPALPAGLTFDPATRTVSGVPTVTQESVWYTLTAMDVDGDRAELRFALGVGGDLVPRFLGSVPAQVYRVGLAIDELALPAAIGGEGPLTYSLAPGLPAGLAFDAATRIVSGTPTAASARTVYTLTATDQDGDQGTLTFTITVRSGAMPTFGGATVPPQNYRVGEAISDLALPAATGGDGTLTYALQPDLPAGLEFDAAARTVTGTPTAESSRTRYTLTATDEDGDAAELEFTIAVQENSAPTFGSAQIPAQRYQVGTEIAELALPGATGGDGSVTYELAPSLPGGLTFDAGSRAISGTPTSPQPETSYTWTATDADGDAAALSFAITVAPPPDPTAARVRALGTALASFGRTGASEAVDAITERFVGSEGQAASQLTVAGTQLPLNARSADEALGGLASLAGLAGYRFDRTAGFGGGRPGFGAYGPPYQRPMAVPVTYRRSSLLDALSRSSFSLSLGQADGPQEPSGWRLWGRGGASYFTARTDTDLDTDGDVLSGFAGLDYRVRTDVLLGVAVSRSIGDIGYQALGDSGAAGAGAVSLGVTSVMPYMHWAPRDGLGLWGLVGTGWGTAELKDGAGMVETDVRMSLAALGGRQELVSRCMVDLAVKADAFFVSLRSNATSMLPETVGDAQRARVMLEGRTEWEVAAGSLLRPSLELGARWDGGTALSGQGAEIGGGIEYLQTERGISLETRWRYLLAHQASRFREWGASVTLRVGSGVDRRGLWFAVTPEWGVPSSGVQAMWRNQQSYPGVFAGLAERSTRLGLEMGRGKGKTVGLAADRRKRPDGTSAYGLLVRSQLSW